MTNSGPLVRALILLFCFLPAGASAAGSAAARHRVALVREDRTLLRASPSTHGNVLATLVQQTQVEVLGRKRNWVHVKIWASIGGWLRGADITFRQPWPSTSTYHAPGIKYPIKPHGPEALRASADTLSAVRVYRAPGRALVGTIPAGRRVNVTAWQQDARGTIWYAVGARWAVGDGLVFRTPDPGLERAGQVPVWKAASGKGMWLTLGTVAGVAAPALVRAAAVNGVSHLYVEAGISPLGFHGRDALGPLLEAAHERHIAVIAWVYPYLYDVAADVGLTRQIATFRTRSGQMFDGIAADLERNFTLTNVRAYSQLVRAYVGAKYLLVGVTYPPQSFATYPFAEVARRYNLIAPMDYWHQTQTQYGLDYGHLKYGYSYAYRYARDSLSVIRRVSGHVPVAPIGQTFDDFGRLEMGPNAPSADEIRGFLSGARDGGAAGVSFFQWMTATVPEWHAIHDFHLSGT